MRRWGVLLALCLAAHATGAAVPAGVEPSVLLPTVGGKPAKEPAIFWQQQGQWFSDATTWSALGVVLKEGESGPLSAQALGVVLAVKEEDATVAITIPPDRAPVQSVKRHETTGSLSPAAPGVLINYSLSGRATQEAQGASLSHEVRTAGRWGVLSTTGQLNVDSTRGGEYRRGITRWQKDDLSRLVTYEAGDVFTGPPSSVVNLGGVRIAKDPKALDPMTPTYPIPTLGGLALDPGTVEVMANQARVLQRDVERGPFVVEGSPLSAGANQAQVVVRDRFGREAVVSDQRYYIAPTLLRPGLTTWDVAVGQVREHENRYGKTGASASLAWGASDRWTLRTNAQADGEGNSNLALGATTTLGTLGTLDLEVGRSSGGGRRVAAAYDYRGPTFGVRLEHERNEDYWRLRPERAADVQERTRASLFWRPSRDLSLRAGYTDLTTDRARVTFADVGVNWRKGPHQVGASVLRDIGRGDTRVEAGYTYALGANRVGVRARSAPNADAWALRYSGRPTLGDTPVSVAAEVERGERGNQVRGAASWNTDTGMARLDAGTGHGVPFVSGGYSGAVHIDGKGVTFLRPAPQGFAVVDVPGQPHVPVRVGGRVVGMTDAKGRLVTGDVAALVPTTVRIDDKALPLGTQVGETEKNAMAGRQAGMHVAFPVLTETARSYTLTGATIPPGTLATTPRETTQVGFDGALYLQHPEPGQVVEVMGVCRARLPADLGSAQSVAQLTCQ